MFLSLTWHKMNYNPTEAVGVCCFNPALNSPISSQRGLEARRCGHNLIFNQDSPLPTSEERLSWPPTLDVRARTARGTLETLPPHCPPLPISSPGRRVRVSGPAYQHIPALLCALCGLLITPTGLIVL